MTSLARIVVTGLAGLTLLASGATAESTRFSPAERSKTLEVGKTEKLDYKLELPARAPHPLDVYLLVDASASMTPDLVTLRPALADGIGRIARRGGDVWFGVGEFRTTGVGDWSDGLTYRRLQALAPAAAASAAVHELGRDRSRLPSGLAGEDAHLIALDQAVRGDGHWPYVRPGGQAGFRPFTRKLVVLVTDERFGRGATQPGRTETIATLNAAGVQVVGLALDPGALEDLTAVARGTGSVASSDVDCGGSRSGRIAAGQPAACVARVDAVGSLLERLFAVASGEVVFSATGTGVRRVDPPSRWVDLTRRNKIPVKLEVFCGPADAGRTHSITLSARIAGQPVATARASIRCKTKN